MSAIGADSRPVDVPAQQGRRRTRRLRGSTDDLPRHDHRPEDVFNMFARSRGRLLPVAAGSASSRSRGDGRRLLQRVDSRDLQDLSSPAARRALRELVNSVLDHPPCD
jgi:hypothetical protein